MVYTMGLSEFEYLTKVLIPEGQVCREVYEDFPAEFPSFQRSF